MGRHKRTSAKELRDVAELSARLLTERGIVHKENLLEEIGKMADAPILPGMPSVYLPHKWTITQAQLAMIGLIKEWVEHTKDNQIAQESSDKFFKFVVRENERIIRVLQGEVKKQGEAITDLSKEFDDKTIAQIFSPLVRFQTAKALRKFYIDSLAIFTINNAGGSVSDYIDWFRDWTTQLYQFWEIKHEKLPNTN